MTLKARDSVIPNNASPVQGSIRLVLEGLGATVGPFDGAARYISGLASHLSREPGVSLLLLEHPSMHTVNERYFARQQVGGSTRVHRLLAQHAFVPRIASRWHADAVIYTGNYCPIITGPPSVAVVQNMLLLEETNDFGHAVALYRRWQADRIARHATRVVAVSQHLANALLERFPHIDEKLSVIAPGVDDLFFVDRSADVNNTQHIHPYFLCVGAAWPYRDYELALSALAASRLDHDLVIAGAATPRDHKRLAQHARRCGLRGDLIMAGNLNISEMRTAYRHATALVATSRTESFGLSILEAMAVGTPVVAVRRTVYPDTVGGAGLLCDVTATSLADGLMAALESRTRQRLIDSGRQRAASARWRTTAAEMAANVRQIIHSDR